KGLYMYVTDESFAYDHTEVAKYGNVNGIRMLNAHGNHDYSFYGNTDGNLHYFWTAGRDLPNFTEGRENPLGQQNRDTKLMFDYNGDDHIQHNSNFNGFGAPAENDDIYYLNGEKIFHLGHRTHFLPGDKLNISSNPYITINQGYLNHMIKPVIIHNLSVEVLPSTVFGKYNIKVSYEDYEITGHENTPLVWTGFAVLKDAQVDGFPQTRLTISQNNTLELDYNYTPTNEDVIRTNPDGTKLFSYPTLFELESGTITTIEDGATLRVKNYSSLYVKDGATLDIQGTGKVIIEKHGHICIAPTANITGTGHIIMEDGSSPYLNNLVEHTHTTTTATTDCICVSQLITNQTFNFENYISGDISITSPDVVWDTDLTPEGDVVIENGARLEINDDAIIRMSEGKKMIIKPGGQLRIIGATIKNNENCSGATWGGIEVIGNSNSSQSISHQGRLVLQDAKIEKALVGVLVGEANDGTIQPNTGGGLVYAHNTTFLDNQKDLKFTPYTHMDGQNNPVGNKSYFNLCRFLTSSNFQKLPSSDIHSCVSLHDVDMVRFLGCEFSDIHYFISGHISPQILNNYGKSAIWSENASMVLNKYVNPITLVEVQNTFNQYYRGVLGTNYSASDYTRFEISNSSFKNCSVGVELTSIEDHVNITHNEFYVNGPNNTEMTGLIATNCKGYEVSQNTFKSIVHGLGSGASDVHLGTGIIIQNNHGENEEITNNTFSKLKNAIKINGINKDPNTQDGLQFRCNIFIRNKVGILVRINATLPDQGSEFNPTGNTFQYQYAPPSQEHINFYDLKRFDAGVSPINYYYSASEFGHKPYLINGNITVNTTVNTANCSSIELGNPTDPILSNKTELQSQFCDMTATQLNTV
ncbi:MAG: hypothetical protein MK066_14380, partial [Crocinitomicaceae bacterium]|nr:hypothetical protein [Crocinitomicaceae bacterium]